MRINSLKSDKVRNSPSNSDTVPGISIQINVRENKKTVAKKRKNKVHKNYPQKNQNQKSFISKKKIHTLLKN